MSLLGALFSILVYAFLFLPMIVLIILSFNSADRGAEWQGATLDWYYKLIANDSLLIPLMNSLKIATTASILSGAIGLCVGLRSAHNSKSGFALTQISQLPIAFPDIVIALSLLALFDLVNLPLGLLTVVLAHTAFGTAYVAIQVRARALLLDPYLEEAAYDLGATRSKTFFKVLFPQLRPALISGMMMVFILSFDDFIIAFFTSGVDSTTLPIKIYSMLKFGVTPEVNALSSLLLLASLALVSLSFVVKRFSRTGVS